MSRIPDSLLMKPGVIAQQLENAYKEGAADATRDSTARLQTIWDDSVAKIFSDRYRKIGAKHEPS